MSGIATIDVRWLTIFNQVAEGKAKLADAQNKAEQFRKDAAKELNKEVDKFDKTVEKKTSEAKSGISSWLGANKRYTTRLGGGGWKGLAVARKVGSAQVA